MILLTACQLYSTPATRESNGRMVANLLRRPVTFAGAVLEADALAAQIGQATMPVGVLLEGKELARTSIDFARLD